MISISMDLDWAPESVVDHVLGLLAGHGIKATIFATHRSAVLEASGNEIGIHPSFTDNDYVPPIRSLLELYPDARGVRSHGLINSSRAVKAFEQYGLIYSSNVMAWSDPRIAPFRYVNGLIEIPLHWGDYPNFSGPKRWGIDHLPLDSERLFVFNFHPIHIYLNTERPERWAAARNRMHDPDALRDLVNPPKSGVGTRIVFERLCQYILDERINTITLGEVASLVNGAVLSNRDRELAP